MKKLLLLFFAILLASAVYSQELGCCLNPNAGALACTNERLVAKDECCPAPDASFTSYYSNQVLPNSSVSCKQNFFRINEDCAANSQCSLGCCCNELGGIIRTQIQCQGGSTFHEGQLDCNSICPPPQCIDGIDNDNNGCADFENGDTGCASISDTSELGGTCADTGPLCNSASYLPKITSMNINPSKGEKKFEIAWNDECSSTSSFYEIFRCSGNCSGGTLTGTSNSASFVDSSPELSFGNTYTYRVVGHYSATAATSSANKSGNLGSIQCLGKLNNNIFCTNNSAYTCDSMNRLSFAGTRCTNAQVCVVNANAASCADKSTCNYNNANPFGLFYTQQGCESGRYCFYDKSHSIVNSCFSCQESMQCYDYKSKGACERNNCKTGDCIWKDTNPALGIGSCINKNDYNCKWCDKKGTLTENLRAYNEIFDSCTKTKSDALSQEGFKCFYKDGKSKNCNEVVCRDYELSSCQNSPITLDGSNNIVNPSSDQCGIKVCQNINNMCVKNADGNSEPDCSTDSCELDYYPPNTSLQILTTKGIPSLMTFSVFDKTGPNGSSILRTSGYSTFFCQGAQCTSSSPTTARRIAIIGLSAFDGDTGLKLFSLNEGQNNVRYYSKDPSNNLEIIKQASIEAHANTSSPRIRMINATGGNLVNGIIYTPSKKPQITISFYEPATITFLRVISNLTGFSIKLNPSSSESLVHTYDTPSDISDATYILEINAKNSKNIFMDKQERQVIIVDSQIPTLSTTPKQSDVINTTPLNILLNFSEQVQLNSASLDSNDIKGQFLQEGRNFRAQINTSDGNKNLAINAQDLAGNAVSRNVAFVMDANPTNIVLSSPRFGVSLTYVFDIVVATDNDAQCRQSLDTEFDFEFMEQFSNSSGTEHIIKNYNKIQQNDKNIHKLHVKCKDERNRESSKSMDISVDTTEPVLKNVFAYPNYVVESPGYTQLTVESDEAVVCKYSDSINDFESMQLKFGGFDQNNFRTTNFQNVTLPVEGKFDFNIACKNKAGLVSQPEKISVEVNFSTEISVASKTQEYFNSTSITLIVETNKRSQCKYSETDTSAQSGNLFGAAGYMHRKDLVVTQGMHTFYVVCRDSFLSLYSTAIPVVFTVDTTAPFMEYVDDTTPFANKEKSCFLDRLRVKMQASDNESGVREYFYSLSRSSDNLVIVNNARTTTGGDWVQIRDLNLSNNTEYFFSAKSRNYVNFESSTLPSDGVTIDTSSCSVSNVSCQDKGDCQINSPCSANSQCITDYCAGSLCKQATCTDGIKNQQESEADCGGPCSKCANGARCTANSDCSSNNCNFGTCKEQDKCFDGQLTPGESDVDCAGPCLQRCDEGKNCDFETSCQDGLDCADSRCAKRLLPEEQQPASTDTDGDGIPDEWEIANAMDPNDPGDAQGDNDDDGLTNEEEYLQQDVFGSTDPNAEDTDGDGYSDLEEVGAGTNPIDPEDFPKSSMLGTLLFIIGIIAMVCGFGYLGYTTIQKKAHKETFTPRQTTAFTPRHEAPAPRPTTVQKTERQLIRKRDEQKEKERRELFDVFDEKVKDIDSGKAQPPEQEFEASEQEKKAPEKKQLKKKTKSKEDVFQKLKEISSSKKSRKKKS